VTALIRPRRTSFPAMSRASCGSGTVQRLTSQLASHGGVAALGAVAAAAGLLELLLLLVEGDDGSHRLAGLAAATAATEDAMS
jgi:hypothetical protein